MKTNNIKINGLISALVISVFWLIFLPSTTLARKPPRSLTTLVPRNWEPSLDQLQAALEEESKNKPESSQQAMNLASQNLADVRDAQLFIVYIQVLQTLDARGQSNLFEEQKNWLNERNALASASVTAKGGTLAPLEYSTAFNKITEARLTKLRKRLQFPHNNPRPKD